MAEATGKKKRIGKKSAAQDTPTEKIMFVTALVRDLGLGGPRTGVTSWDMKRAYLIADEESPALVTFLKQKGWHNEADGHKGQFVVKLRGTQAEAICEQIIYVGPEEDPKILPYAERGAWWDQAINIVCYDWGITDLEKAKHCFVHALVGGSIESHLAHFYEMQDATNNLHFYASGNKLDAKPPSQRSAEKSANSDKLDDWFPRDEKPDMPEWFAKPIEAQEFALREHIKRELNIAPGDGAALGQHVGQCFAETLGSPLKYLRQYGPGKALETVKNYCREAQLQASKKAAEGEPSPKDQGDPLRPEIRAIFSDLEKWWERESGANYDATLESLGLQATDEEWKYIAETMDARHGPTWRPYSSNLGPVEHLDGWRADLQQQQKEKPMATDVERSVERDTEGATAIIMVYTVSATLYTPKGRPWTYTAPGLSPEEAETNMVALIKARLEQGFTLDAPAPTRDAPKTKPADTSWGGSKPAPVGKPASQPERRSGRPSPGDTGTFNVYEIERRREAGVEKFLMFGKNAKKQMYTFRGDSDLEKLGRGILAVTGNDIWDIELGERVECRVDVDWKASDPWGANNIIFQNVVDVRAAQ